MLLSSRQEPRPRPTGGPLAARLGLPALTPEATELVVLSVTDPGLAGHIEQRAASFDVTTTTREELVACQGRTVVPLLRELRRSLAPEELETIRVVFPRGADEDGSPLTLEDFDTVQGCDLEVVLRPGSEALVPAFQPVVRLSTKERVGYEGLIRGRRGARIIPPERLFTLARSEARLIELDRAATAATLRAAAGWLAGELLFLNFTPAAFDVDRVDEVARAAEVLEIPPHTLVLEIVETERIATVAGLQAAVGRARQHGMRVALDDVGAGYASLELMCRLDPDVLKISMGLTHQLPRSRGIVAGLALAASHTGAEIVLEGVETAEQERCASELGIDLVQGFRFGRPSFEPAA